MAIEQGGNYEAALICEIWQQIDLQGGAQWASLRWFTFTPAICN